MRLTFKERAELLKLRMIIFGLKVKSLELDLNRLLLCI